MIKHHNYTGLINYLTNKNMNFKRPLILIIFLCLIMLLPQLTMGQKVKTKLITYRGMTMKVPETSPDFNSQEAIASYKLTEGTMINFRVMFDAINSEMAAKENGDKNFESLPKERGIPMQMELPNLSYYFVPGIDAKGNENILLAGATAYDEFYGIYVSYTNPASAKGLKKALRSIRAAKSAPGPLTKPEVTLQEIEVVGLKLKVRSGAEVISDIKSSKNTQVAMLAGAAGLDKENMIYVENRYIISIKPISGQQMSASYIHFRVFPSDDPEKGPVPPEVRQEEQRKRSEYLTVAGNGRANSWPGRVIYLNEKNQRKQLVVRKNNVMDLMDVGNGESSVSFGISPEKVFGEGITKFYGVASWGLVQPALGWEVTAIALTDNSIAEVREVLATLIANK